jgi:thermitase
MNISANYRILLITLACLLILSAVSASAQQYEPDHLVVEMKEGFSIDLVNAQFGTTTAQHLQLLDVYLLNVPLGADLEALSDEILQMPEVEDCHPNFFVDPMQSVQGSLPISDDITGDGYNGQPAVRALRLPEAHEISTGAGVKVAVLDGGVDYTHPALQGHVISGYDYIDNDSDAFDEPGGANHGHGTFVAGIIHLVAPDAQIVSYRVADTAGRSDGYLVAEAMMQAIADSCRVINISMVMYGQHAAIRRAIRYGYEHRCVTIVASGNGADTIPRYPASDGLAVSVAALDSTDALANFSSYGSHINVCAPGEAIHSTYLDSAYAVWSGSSFAAPFVAGEAALLTAYKPYFSGFHVWTCLLNGADNIDAENPDYVGMLGNGKADPDLAFTWDPVICGDVDGSGSLAVTDMLRTAYYLADLANCGDSVNTPVSISPAFLEAADVNGVSGVNVTDLGRMLRYYFGVGEPPCAGSDPAPSSLGSVVLDSVDGLVGQSELTINEPITFYLRVDASDAPLLDIVSSGFRLYSPDSAEWSGLTIPTDGDEITLNPGEVNIAVCKFDSVSARLGPASCSVSESSGFGILLVQPIPIPAGYSGVLFRISIGSFGSEDIGKTLFLDTATFGNGANWTWDSPIQGSILPAWGGPYRFTIVEPDYYPGDINNDGFLDVSDLIYAVDYAFAQGAQPVNPDACDVNGDCCVLDISDLTYLVDYFFGSGVRPVYGCSRPGSW